METACEALRGARCLAVRYGGFERLIEVHVVGSSAEGVPLMRVWQISGGSASGESVGWKLFRLDEIETMELSTRGSAAPRPDYNDDDPLITAVICRV